MLPPKDKGEGEGTAEAGRRSRRGSDGDGEGGGGNFSSVTTVNLADGEGYQNWPGRSEGKAGDEELNDSSLLSRIFDGAVVAADRKAVKKEEGGNDKRGRSFRLDSIDIFFFKKNNYYRELPGLARV